MLADLAIVTCVSLAFEKDKHRHTLWRASQLSSTSQYYLIARRLIIIFMAGI